MDHGGPTNTLVSGVLDTLGVEHTFTELEGAPVVLDSRAREGEEGPYSRTGAARVVYVDDHLPIEDSISRLQGKAEPSGSFLEPSVSVGAKSLLDAIRGAFSAGGLPLVTKGYWPDGAPACLVLTHDVDWFTYSPFHRAVARGNPLPRLLALVLRYAGGRRYGYNIDSVIGLEAKLGVRSTFLFRNSYGAVQGMLGKAVAECKGAGCEVALHASKKSYKLPEVMEEEKSVMERVSGMQVAGTREHMLKFDRERTWKCIESAGLTYDMTFGVNEKLGFLAGLCHPYHPMSDEGRAYRFVEIPTSFMDWTAIRSGLGKEELTSVMRKLKDSVLSLNGCLCVNFHNTYIDGELFPEIERAYRLLIEECKASGFWVATAKECAEWWLDRRRVPLDVSFERGELRVSCEDPRLRPVVYPPDGEASALPQDGGQKAS